MNRFAKAPFGIHAALLLIVMLAVLAAIRPLGPVVTDEGAAVTQARALETTGQWLIPEPPAVLDPKLFGAFANSDNGDKGRAFYAKHPAYPLLLQGADRIAGRFGMFLLSVMGAWLAAVLCALISRRLFGAHERTVLWLTGVASPLLFYGNTVLAHTLACAAAALAALLTVDVVQGRRRPLRLVLLFASCALAAMLRSEGAFAGAAIAVASIAVMRTQGRALLVAGAAVAGTAAGVMVDAVAVRSILGSPSRDSAEDTALVGRISGSFADWFQPSVEPSTLFALLLTLSGFLLLIAAIRTRKRGIDGFTKVIWTIIAVAYVVLAVTKRDMAISGLALAFPVGWFGILLVGRAEIGTPERTTLLATAGIVAAAVAITNYSDGGGYQWGGRYFAIALPFALPFVAAAIHRVLQGRFEIVAGAMVVTTLAASAIAVDFIHDTHRSSQALERLVVNELPELQRQHPTPTEAPSAGRPFVVWPRPLVMQLAWNGVDTRRFVGPNDEAEIPALFATLRNLNEPVVIVVTPTPDEDERAMDPYFRVVERRDASGVGVATLVAVAR